MKKLLIFLVCFLPVLSFAQSGYITTFAGTIDSAGYSGDGGPATAARIGMSIPSLCADFSGNIYFLDEISATFYIRKVDGSGNISTIAGGGTSTADGIAATAAEISPAQLTTDLLGNVYFSEAYAHRIRKINISTGLVSTVAGIISTYGYSGDGGLATAAELYHPFGICFDRLGNLFITDNHNYVVRKVDTSGIISTVAGNRVHGYSGDGGPATAAQLGAMVGICSDVWGNLFVSDAQRRIRKIDPAGIITTFAGSGLGGFSGDGGPATLARFWGVENICTDMFGNLYVADIHSSRVRLIDAAGIVTTVAGGGTSRASGVPATAASFNLVYGIAVDYNNNFYFNDLRSYRLCKVQGLWGATASSESSSVYIRATCYGIQLNFTTSSFVRGMSLRTYYGDGGVDSSVVFAGYGGAGNAISSHTYASNGSYTIKQALYSGRSVVDSLQFTYTHTLCNAIAVGFYFDANGNCTNDSGDVAMGYPLTLEVDSNGVAIDTLSATSGLFYNAYGAPGDVYAFRVISVPTGFSVACPATGVIYDTLSSSMVSHPTKYMGFECGTGSTAFDLRVFNVVSGTGIDAQSGTVYASNAYCLPTNATVTLNFSPRFRYRNAIPVPTTTSRTSITWNLSGLSSVTGDLAVLSYYLEVSGSRLTIRDTVHSTVNIAPYTGDADTANNWEFVIDTVRAGYDPNAIYVKPGGCIASGVAATELQYKITFENMGNDTAHNIYVLDTLPDFVDVNSMRIEMSSHTMYTSKYKDAAGHNILKFDFPNIKLLDSSYHGLCDGAVIYHIYTKPGLANGTDIMNRAGIYFDVNDVVMTNEAHTLIGCPIVSVNQYSLEALQIYPNPTGDQLHIDMTADTYESCTITNSIGVVVASQSLTQQRNTLNVRALPTGMYYVTLRGVGGVRVKKFVKE